MRRMAPLIVPMRGHDPAPERDFRKPMLYLPMGACQLPLQPMTRSTHGTVDVVINNN
jgi:hypothetical protein